MKQLFIFILISCFSINSYSKTVSIENLSVEMRVNPIGIDVQQPRLSWQIASKVNNVQQIAYQIQVSTVNDNFKNDKNIVWNSEKIQSNKSILIPYKGLPLLTGKTYYWNVKVWTNKGQVTSNVVGSWGMAYVDTKDWKSTWIGLDSITNADEQLLNVVNTRLSARYLRKEFSLSNTVKSAKLHISGLGLYECYLNGSKVGKDIFSPTATDYDKQVNYNTYDVTSMLTNTKNTLGVVLGNGRFVALRMAKDKRFGVPATRHFGFPKLIMQLEIEYLNGETKTIVSDTSWKLTTKGPIVTNSEFDGEEYNANFEMTGWSSNGFDDSNWLNARKVDAPLGKLIAQKNPNMTTMEEIKPISIQLVNGKYILDMGQNMVGWLAVKLKAQKNKPIKMRFAESLQKDGSLYMANLRGAEVTNIYTPSKDGEFSWCPTFTYQGFRYAEISGIDYMPQVTDFKGMVNYDEMKTIGRFETSNALLNQIYKNACWGIKGNYRSFPTDCPQRDERMPWLGDRATGCFGESFIFDNGLLYEKWAQDIEESQKENGSIPNIAPSYWPMNNDNVTWPSAFIHVTNMLYEQRGDIQPIIKHYAAMKKWMEYMKTTYMKEYIIGKDVYGDWCMPPEKLEIIHSQDPNRKTEKPILASSFYYRLVVIMAKFAEISGNETDITLYNELAEQIKKAYNDKFLNKENGYYGNNTVTANLVSLMQDLVPEAYQQKVVDNIVNKTEGEFKSHVGVGLIGIQFLMRGLSAHGKGDLAYKIATNTTYPSWGYMIENNATTIWELWNGITADPAMNSGNHVMLLGDLLSWYYENLAGIRTDKTEVGFKKIIMKPIFPEGLNFVKASTESPYGKIASAWNKTQTGLEWTVEIPANSSAELNFTSSSLDKITNNNRSISGNKNIQLIDNLNGIIRIQVSSGKYNFKLSN